MVILEFTGLLLIIVFAAYLLSRGAEVLADKWGYNIVGSLILALFTTLPEYAFVYWASVKGQYQMAIGSAIGSCTLLITLGYGLVIWLATSKLSKKPVKEIRLSKATRIDALYLLITGLIAFAFVWQDNALSLWEGIVLALVFGGYVFQVFQKGKSHVAPEHHRISRRAMVRAGVEIVLGGIIVYLASEPFVDSMIHIAELMKVSPVVIAIVLGPIASEMPEKLTAYMVVLKNGHKAELSICNFIGSKVNHNSLLLAVMPFVAHFKGHDIVRNLMSPMFVMMTVLTVFVSALLAKGRLQKWQGIGLVGAYVLAMILATQQQ
ncbi:MAG: sodium:calcium antiporter [Armatimonadota bacterium]